MTPQAYRISKCGVLEPMERAQLDLDPRGVCWLFEEPSIAATYFMGIDPTKGIIGWSRQFRTQDDFRTNNGAIEILRAGKPGKPDVQVAEYAAPIDAEDLGDYANALGRIYGGANEEAQCMAIIEVWPGPGELTQRRLISRYGYTNLYVPVKYANTLAPERGRNVVGWVSNERSRRDLWMRGVKHIELGRIIFNSPWLVEEMADCKADDYMLSDTARAKYGKYDDRVVAMLLAIYAAHDWGAEIETDSTRPTEGEDLPDWQKTDISSADLEIAWAEAFDRMAE